MNKIKLNHVRIQDAKLPNLSEESRKSIRMAIGSGEKEMKRRGILDGYNKEHLNDKGE